MKNALLVIIMLCSSNLVLAGRGACFRQLEGERTCVAYASYNNDLIEDLKETCNFTPFSRWITKCPYTNYGCNIEQTDLLVRVWYLDQTDRDSASLVCKMSGGYFISR